ncbi:uncharacterized protein BDW43DRAFT_263331 [Aspergillus alliaceus]|uniref:uncharacterized protein n=1 Tax=Petromyces alliaceus TaxID=209559 RepID=UPI0012A641DF|nr:uncharacterized protein BDW43DRAFT_263331 [Aspergillus alliaceus]KAB8238247.1 hypothetical protein BDW43DRAFT_263331 [Aspergillus alliaceus]
MYRSTPLYSSYLTSSPLISVQLKISHSHVKPTLCRQTVYILLISALYTFAICCAPRVLYYLLIQLFASDYLSISGDFSRTAILS